MRTVKEVSELTGVSIRTLHYYDEIGLLCPTDKKMSGYRLYDDTALERLQQILMFRELEFPLKEIKEILDSPHFERKKALKQQLELLQLKKAHLEDLIAHTRELLTAGGKIMDFKAFDTSKIEAYTKEAKANWGNTDTYKEFEEKKKDWKKGDMEKITTGLMEVFKEIGSLKELSPEDEKVQETVQMLRDYITAHFYDCTPEILSGLGCMYSAGGEMTTNIDQYAGAGTAVFADEAIKIYCKKYGIE